MAWREYDENYAALKFLRRQEKENLIRLASEQLGFHGEAAAEITDAITAVYEATTYNEPEMEEWWN